jgi:5-methylcytosine-specific restriction endonuclease McrA
MSSETTAEKYSKTSISKTLRQLVWNRYIGARHGLGWCWCCRSTQISAFAFECGHVVSESDGGATTVENLRPICSLCNRSMGTKNMISFQKDNGMSPSSLVKGIEWMSNSYYALFH